MNKPDLSALSHGEALRYFRKHASLRPHELPALDHGTGPRALRRSGLTQEQLAHRGGLSVRTIRNIESGQNVPEAESVHVLVNALELSEEQRTLFEAAVERERARRRERGQDEARERERVRLARTGNLPPAVTDFVGREAEVAAVTRELETTRLLTLTGPGGCGKTQLALRAADELRGRYDGGVWLVALAAVDDANLLVPTVARALGIGESLGSDDPLAVLAGFFAAASTLLLLDTCEHLIDACAALVESLLAACRSLHILATSREVLHLVGEERPWPVPPLALPPAGAEPSWQDLAHYDAVQLFARRAYYVALTDADAADVLQICQRLDGLPLAIELAAACSAILSPRQVAQRLDERFSLLTRGRRTAPPRQQTLRATMDWSYNLLPEPEQQILRRLAVFVGSCTIEGAMSVCSDGPGHLDTLDTLLEGIGELGNKSLMRSSVDTVTERRFDMLDTIRAYGLERLEASGEAALVRRRHANYIVTLAQRIAPQLLGPEQQDGLNRLELEYGNVLAVVDWAARGGHTETGLRLIGALRRFLLLHNHLEIRPRLEALLADAARAEPAVDLAVYAAALSAAGALAYRQGDYSRSAEHFTRNLELRRAQGDQATIAGALNNLANALVEQGEYERAKAYYREGFRLHKALGKDSRTPQEIAVNRGNRADLLNNLGNVALHQGAYRRGELLYRASHTMFESVGNEEAATDALHNTAQALHMQGKLDAAARGYEESLTRYQRQDNQWAIAAVLNHHADLALARGDIDRATRLCRESLQLRQGWLDRQGIASCLNTMAAVACAREQWTRAARLFGAEAALRASIGAPLALGQRDRQAGYVAAGRKALGNPAWTRAYLAGKALPLEQAVADALEVSHP